MRNSLSSALSHQKWRSDVSIALKMRWAQACSHNLRAISCDYTRHNCCDSQPVSHNWGTGD